MGLRMEVTSEPSLDRIGYIHPLLLSAHALAGRGLLSALCLVPQCHFERHRTAFRLQIGDMNSIQTSLRCHILTGSCSTCNVQSGVTHPHTDGSAVCHAFDVSSPSF